ncbi:MAG: copper-binding protein [Burkholderiales bacterium]|nr:copper-binding protein [Burkholderiales bacterium]
MNQIATPLTALLLSIAAAGALAQAKPEEHSAHHLVTAPVADMSEGEVRKVDKDSKKLTIKHGEIRNLDMPAMTMVFQVKDPAMLDKVKPGDKIRFVVENTGAGMVVTELRLAN